MQNMEVYILKLLIYVHDRKLLIEKFTDFTLADDDFEPICLKGKHWELIKLDMINLIETLEN